ncbi:hypothetical protein ACFC9J_15570 [Enterococcus casseliflavus]|uniref:hypothetical protein n=1 Tax=Enterococcus TaxID=1350 RepID=UPI0028A90554|nr:hypothetical protein [Enterococcus sp.]EME8079746.1 hypothetical protein [Enterococcus faecium]
MKTRHRKGGYSAQIASDYIEKKQPIHSLSIELEKQFRFEDGKPTKEITGYKAWFSQEGIPPFVVKFAEEIKLPNYLSLVQLDNLEAVEVNYNVYFRATGLTEVK